MVTPISREDWIARAASCSIRNQAFVDGKFVPALSGRTFDCVSPLNGKLLTKISACDTEDVEVAVRAARRSFEAGVWSHLSPAKRKTILLRFADTMQRHAEELALLETLDVGKPIRFSAAMDVPAAVNCVRWFAEAIDKIYDEIAPTDPAAVAMVTREPVGVVGAVVPWNFPLVLASWKIAPALAAGNSVVLKPAEQSPLTAIRIAELASEAGLPDGVFNVVPGFGETAGQALGRHMDVDSLAFTGSTEVGRLFLRYASESNLKRVSLECGGKSPNIILADAPDLNIAAHTAAMGIFLNQGQVCNAGSRLLVQDSIREEFLEKLLKETSSLVPADPLDPSTMLGALVDHQHTKRVMNYIAAGQDCGAKLLAGGKQARTDSGGCFIEPTIFDRVDNNMSIAREEIFGPVLSTIAFRELDEAITIANDSIYGLAAAVWTRDIRTAHLAARRLKAGTVWVNTYNANDISTPFGGYKQSGFGRDKSLHAFDKYVQLKTTWFQLN